MMVSVTLPSAIDTSHPTSQELTDAERMIHLLSIAAAVVDCDNSRIIFVATNAAFRAAGLGLDADRSTLVADHGDRLSAFVASDEAGDEFGWCIGEDFAGRHFRVTVARIAAGARRCLVTLLDQTSELRTEQSLRREMTTDSLTGLPNRAGFIDRIESGIMLDRDRYAVMMIDLDQFSRVNACFGSLTGDELLITVARRLKSALRGHDVLARTGGDEFGILLVLDGGSRDAQYVAKRIRGAFADPFRMSDYEVQIGCSLGIAFGSETTGGTEELIRHAQFALKRSKASGEAEVYQTQAFDVVRGQFAMETALRRAIDGGLLRLVFQPICDLATGRISSFESLARWKDEDGREHSPCEFIPVAEESGLIMPLGRWALATATRTLADWDRRAGSNCGVRMSVNLSAIQLQRDEIAPLVAEQLAATGLQGNRLKLELTESALISDPDRIARMLEELKALGTTLAMDDFGTGYSNLAYLQKLPIDILKIDRSFITGMLVDRDKVAIVRAILSLAQALGMKTVAEGIETVEVAQTLTALGCDYGQGYFYARPLEAEAAFQMLVAQRA